MAAQTRDSSSFSARSQSSPRARAVKAVATAAAMSAILLSGSGGPRVQARAASYTLSGSPDGTAMFEVDDNLDVYLNGIPVYSDNTLPNTPATRPPIALTADIGDTLRFVVRDTYGVCAKLTTVFLTDAAGRSTVADPGFDIGCGRPNVDQGVVHEFTFVIPDLAVVPTATFVGEMRPGAASAAPSDFAVFQNALYFAATDDVHGRELWRLGTTGAPTLVADLLPGAAFSNPRDLTVAGDRLYFVATSPNDGEELWHYDGVTPPSVATDIWPGAESSDILFLTALGTEVVFRANDSTGDDLFAFGPTSGLKPFDLWQNDPSCDPGGGGCGSYPYGLTVYQGILYFGASDEVFGTELHQYDGTTVTRLTDIIGNLSPSDPEGMTGIGNRLVFSAYAGFSLPKELYAYDIATRVPTLLSTGVTGGFFGASPLSFTSFNGRAYFSVDDATIGRELWTTDGTQAGTRLVADLNPGAAASNPRTYASFNGELYFRAVDATAGNEMWATNGVTVRPVIDLNPGPANSSYDNPTPFGAFLVFSLDLPVPSHPWVTTGTAPGTHVVRQADGTLINPTGSSVDDAEFIAFNGALYFSATDGVRGNELWRITLGASAPTTTSLTSSLNPSIVGDQVTLTAIVAGGGVTPTGSVTFFDGTTLLGTVSLLNGSASFNISSLGRGSHTMTASYSGDAGNAVSTSAPLIQVVNGQPTTTLLTSSTNPSAVGSPVMFRAAVSGGAVGGSVTFHDGAIELGTVSLAAGIADLTTAALSIGSHSITATYNGDAVFAASTSNTLVQVVEDVGGTPTSTTLMTSPNPSAVSQAVTLTATVTGQGIPAGSVTFRNGGVDLGTPVQLVGGSASLITTTLLAGTHQLTASYGGDLANDPSVSPPIAHVVNRLSQVVGLFSSKNPSKIGDSVTFTATLNGDSTGNVTFFDNGVSLGSSAVVGGQTTLTVSTLAIGVHPIVARYDGDAKYLPADSATVNQTVNPLNSAPQIFAIADVTVRWGQAIAFTAVATDVDGDAVTFTLPNPPTGASMTPGGQFTWTPTSTQTGTYPLIVEASDGSLVGTRSFTITVQPHVTTIGLLLPFTAAPGPVELRAELRDLTDGTPLANQSVLFELGTQSVTAMTDATGVARGALQLAQPGGQVAYRASFAGSPAYLPSTQAATFVVNLPPVIAPIPPQQLPWGRTLTLPISISNPDGDPLSVVLLSGPAGLQLNGSVLSWTPTASQTGTATATVRVNDTLTVTTVAVLITVTSHPTQLSDLEPSMGGDRIFPRATLIDLEFAAPIPLRTVDFTVGTQRTAAATDQLGVARGSLTLVQAAGPSILEASFAGEPGYAASALSRPFQIVGAPTTDDSDGDGLSDDWETTGVDIDGNGTIDLDLPALGANPLRKDIFVEIDWMVRPPTCVGAACFNERAFQPQAAALQLMIDSFAAAPVPNPDGSSGITLHIDAGPLSIMNAANGDVWGTQSRATVVPYDAVLGQALGGFGYDWSEFDAIKQVNFEIARRPVFRYGIFADTFPIQGVYGIARDIGATDFIVAAGNPDFGQGGMTAKLEGHVVMHELGHLLGLGHGGGDSLNFKPNYTSIMNYAFPLGLPPEFREDFSGVAEPTVDEVAAGIDVNGDGGLSLLEGFDDWANLAFTGGGIGGLLIFPTPAQTPLIDPGDLGIGDSARDGDGVVVFRGPWLLVSNSGAQTLAADVSNVSNADAQYTVSFEGGWLTDPSAVAISVAANQIVRVWLPIDTTGASPGEHRFVLTLRSAGGAVLHQSQQVLLVLDLTDPASADLARQTADALRQLPPDSGLDPAVVAAIIEMVAEAEVSWQAVVVVTGRPAFSATYRIDEPIIGGLIGLIRAQSAVSDPEFLMDLLRVGSLAAGRVRMRSPSGAIFEAPVAGRWNATTRTFDGKWAISRQTGSITVQLKAP